MTEFRIFLSSPEDCAAERDATRKVVAKLNADPLIFSFAQVEVAAWDWGHGIPFDALKSPQASVNEHVATPENCDVFVGVFGRRFGKSLTKSEFRRPDGGAYKSGSEYEFHRAWNARRRGNLKPDIFMYRWGGATPKRGKKDEQTQLIEAFFSQPPFSDNDEAIGGYQWFSDTDKFSEKLESMLRSMLATRSPGCCKPFHSWMRDQAVALSANAGPRYTSDAHVNTDISRVFDWLLIRKTAVQELDEAFKSVFQALRTTMPSDDCSRALESFAELLRADSSLRDCPDFDFLDVVLRDVAEKVSDKLKAIQTTRLGETSLQNTRARQNEEFYLTKAYSATRTAQKLLTMYAPLASKRILLLKGPSGQGKTHTLVHEINATLDSHGIAVGVLGQTLSSHGPIWDAIRARLSWPESADSLLDKLNNEATASGQRALIVIDALNEMPDRRRWLSELMSMIQDVLRRPQLVLALSVRSDYIPTVIPSLKVGQDTPWVLQEHPGFLGLEPAGLETYFRHYGLKVPSAPTIGEFSNPLYVQMLARSLDSGRFKHWQPSWLEVWARWIERLEIDSVERLGQVDPSRRNPMRRTMNRLAQAMLAEPNFTLTRQRADEIAHEVFGQKDVIGFLCSAGALVDRIVKNDEEVVEFGFERLSDTFFTHHLLEKILGALPSTAERRSALAEALESDGPLMALRTEHPVEHPLFRRRAGLLAALCVATPREVGAEFPTFFNVNDNSELGHELAYAFVDSLRWRSEQYEFGAEGEELYALWHKYSGINNDEPNLDRLIRFALMPGHPFAMDRYLHPRLLGEETIGARDAWWSVELPSIWALGKSNLKQLVNWSSEADLDDVQSEIALPAAQLLAWVCATSQKQLRQKAMQGLTRLSVACPQMLSAMLPDFMLVNDPYVLEAVLLAFWGVLLRGVTSPELAEVVNLVATSQFPDGNPRWCHISIRHYVRKIVDTAQACGIKAEVTIHGQYKSAHLLDEIPDEKLLAKIDTSNGFRTIIDSSIQGDFYDYVIRKHPLAQPYERNFASVKISDVPLPSSQEPDRPFHWHPIGKGDWDDGLFDCYLAGRFVAWNTLALGYSGQRFDDFDTKCGLMREDLEEDNCRTERIGKKFQWISWHMLLAFLTDNYALNRRSDGTRELYDSPEQLGVRIYDPTRWLLAAAKPENKDTDDIWKIPVQRRWPRPDAQSLRDWIESIESDPKPADVLESVVDASGLWGKGPWIRVATEHESETSFAPGYWDEALHAGIWMQSLPLLVQETNFGKLLRKLNSNQPSVQPANGRWQYHDARDTTLTSWSAFRPAWDCGFERCDIDSKYGYLPVPSRIFAGLCGYKFNVDEQKELLLPSPSLFREWGLELQRNQPLLRRGKDVVFGLTNTVGTGNTLFANVEILQKLLEESNYRLVWLIQGFRHANIIGANEYGGRSQRSVWADYRGIAFLGLDSRVEIARLEKKIKTNLL